MIDNIEKEKLDINQLMGRRKKNVVVEGDVIVPDIKPDILGVINSNANCYTHKRELQENKIRIDGNVNLYIVYLASSGENRSLNAILDFSESMDFENINDTMNLAHTITVKSIETKILNERKINIKANLELEVKVYNKAQIEFLKDLNVIENAKILEQNVNMMTLKGSGTARASAKENINIDNIDELAEIFKVDIKVSNKENKISYNKILAKADIDVKIMYLTEDDRINTVKASIPIMGFVDMQGIAEGDVCNSNYNMRNLIVKPNSKEEHSIYIELDYDVDSQAYENRNMNIPQDIYGLKNDIVFSKKNINVLSMLEERKDKMQIRESIELGDVNKIYDADCKVNVLNKKVYENKINIEGEIEIKFLYEQNSSNTLNTKLMRIPFNKIADCTNPEDMEIYFDIIDENFIVNSNDSVDCNIECECTISGGNDIKLSVIDDINIEECNTENYCSMVIYFVKPKDTLWSIAKQFKSTIDDIKYVNGIDDESKISVGDKLYISRCS